MTTDDLYRSVMMVEPSAADTSVDPAARENAFESVWSRPGLSVRERRIVTIVCVAGVVDVPATDAHIYAALKSGDLTIEQLNEFTLHFAVYCGWPKASQMEACVRAQWQRIHDERGEPTPAFPERTLDDLGPTDHAERIAGGQASFEEINLVPAPPADSPYFHGGILNFVFGHLWLRPGLTRRERRLITVPCVGVSDAAIPIWSHVTSALASGDLSYDEMQEVILQFKAYAGAARAQALQDIADQWKGSQP